MEQKRKPPYRRRELDKFLAALDEELSARGSGPVELSVGGGFVMARQMRFRLTNDIDIFGGEMHEDVRDAARAVAFRYGISADWINDAAKGVDLPLASDASTVYDGIVLRVTHPGPRYILASKLIAARRKDLRDCVALTRRLRLNSASLQGLLAQACGGELKVTPDQARFAEQVASKARKWRLLWERIPRSGPRPG